MAPKKSAKSASRKLAPVSKKKAIKDLPATARGKRDLRGGAVQALTKSPRTVLASVTDLVIDPFNPDR
jgi:hypothetical protein